jgi:hypothetical protein
MNSASGLKALSSGPYHTIAVSSLVAIGMQWYSPHFSPKHLMYILYVREDESMSLTASMLLLILCMYTVQYSTVLEFLNNLWGLGTE